MHHKHRVQFNTHPTAPSCTDLFRTFSVHLRSGHLTTRLAKN